MVAGKDGVAATPWWDPDRFAERREILLMRARAGAAVRAFFALHGFVEVETPCLQVSPGMEPHLKYFTTTLSDPLGGADQPMGLQTSPEFAMKKLLVAGMPRIFQLARVFRNAERSDTHHPEFTMLEWYRLRAPLSAVMEDAEAMVRACAEAVGVGRLTRDGAVCNPFLPWERVSMAEAFTRHAGIDLLATAPDPHHPDRDALAAAAARIGVMVGADDRWDDLVFRIMMERIEPRIGREVPTIVHSWPVSMAALARPSPEDGRVAERFEVYALGLELANAFGELTDAAEQRRRFAEDAALARTLYGAAPRQDEDFLRALEYGMPDAAGIALGFDRLVMLLTGARRIDQVLWAPVAGGG